MTHTGLAATARMIFERALTRCDVRAAVSEEMERLDIGDAAGVLLVAMGKAAVAMHDGACAALADKVPVRGLVVAPPATFQSASTAEVLYLLGNHPVPGRNSERAAAAVLEALRLASPQTLVVFLISGGASAMVEAPLAAPISMEDLIQFHRVLVGAGMPITQMNSVRKHLSAVKGGRLAMAARHALAQVTLLVSDVPEGCEDVIASGPTLPDSSSREDCRRVMESLSAELRSRVPTTVLQWFDGAAGSETPKPGNPAFARATYRVLLSSRDLALAAAAEARALGFEAVIDPSSSGSSEQPELDYREAVKGLLDRSLRLARVHARTCVINSGEIAVSLGRSPGEGGRNQQAALYAAQQLARRGQRAVFLSAGSDGIDGASGAAGAVCDEATVTRAMEMGLDCEGALMRFDAAPLLRAVGDQIVTGPTGNNLRDLRLVLSA